MFLSSNMRKSSKWHSWTRLFKDTGYKRNLLVILIEQVSFILYVYNKSETAANSISIRESNTDNLEQIYILQLLFFGCENCCPGRGGAEINKCCQSSSVLPNFNWSCFSCQGQIAVGNVNEIMVNLFDHNFHM